MATSGSVDFTLTARELIQNAYELAGVYGDGEAVNANDASSALVHLNLMVKTWGAQERLWVKTETTQALSASTASYTLSAARKVLSVRRRTSSIDTPLLEISHAEYQDIPSKAQTGYPLQWYFDRQRSTKLLYVWPVPTAAIAASTTLYYTYLRAIEDFDDLANDPDVPQEWLEALTYNLAKRLALLNSVPSTNPARYAEIKQAAELLYAGLSAYDQETASVFLQPDYG